MVACHFRPVAAFLRGERWAAFDCPPYAREAQRHEVAVPSATEAVAVPLVDPLLGRFRSSVAEALSLEHILLCVANAASNSLIDVEIRRAAAVAVGNSVRAVAVEHQAAAVAAAVVVAAAGATVSEVDRCSFHLVCDLLQHPDCFVAVAKCFEDLDSRHVLDEVDSLLDGAADPVVDLAVIQRDCASAYSVRDCRVDLVGCQDSREIGLEAHIVVNTEIAEGMDPFACSPSVACVADSLACVREVLAGPFGRPFVNPD